MKTTAALLALFLSLPVFSEELRVPIPGHDDLIFDLPSGWHSQVRRSKPDLPPTISLSGTNPGGFQVLITPIWPFGTAQPPSATEIRTLVQSAATQAQPQAVESELKLKDLGANGKSGYYFSATDRQPEPGGYKYLTQGAVGFNELRITFTILVNDEPQEATSIALELLRSMHRASAKNTI